MSRRPSPWPLSAWIPEATNTPTREPELGVVGKGFSEEGAALRPRAPGPSPPLDLTGAGSASPRAGPREGLDTQC